MPHRRKKGMFTKSQKRKLRRSRHPNRGGEKLLGPRRLDQSRGVTRIGWDNIKGVPIMVGPETQGGLPLHKAEQICSELLYYSRYSVGAEIEQDVYCPSLDSIVHIDALGQLSRPKLKETGEYGRANNPEEVLDYKPPRESEVVKFRQSGHRSPHSLDDRLQDNPPGRGDGRATFQIYDRITILIGPEDEGGFDKRDARVVSVTDAIREACTFSRAEGTQYHIFIPSLRTYVQIDFRGRVKLPRKYPDARYGRTSSSADIIGFNEFFS